jgi:hypothetical protein
VVQHLNTGKHNKNINLKAKSKQSFIKNTLDNQNKQTNYSLDLCQAMLESDIPLWKLNHPSFKIFLEKYTGKCVNVFLTSLQFAKTMFLQFMKILFLVFVRKLVMAQFGFQ